MTDYFYNLPDELQLLIFSFDPTYMNNFKDNLKKLNEEFYKGGFYRNSLNIQGYVKDQGRWCRRYCVSGLRKNPVKSWINNIQLYNTTTKEHELYLIKSIHVH
jgi:hypothetical protein